MWRRRGKAASAAAPYSAHHGLYSEAVVSSVASAVALAEVGRFREAVEYVQKAAKALYEAAKEVFERVKVTVQRLMELFVEAVARVLAWIDEHKAYLFLMAAVAARIIALSVALNLWGMIELERLAYAASFTPFVPTGVKEYSREEVFKMLKEASDPYEKFKKIAREANSGKVKLAEPWESLRVLILPKKSEEERLMHGWAAELYSKYREDENYKGALFYAFLALEEAFSDYRTALGEYAKGLREAVQKRKVGEEPFEKVVYVADLGQLKQLAEEEEEAFGDALRILREKLNEYAHRYGVGDLNVEEGKARGLAEAEDRELSKFTEVNFGTKAYAALIAYREYTLGRRSAFDKAAGYWLEVGGPAWLLYYAPSTSCRKAKRAKAERPAVLEEMVAEALRRLFLKPGADHYSDFIKLLGSGKLVLELMEEKTNEEERTRKKTESCVFKLYRLEEGGKLNELGISLKISKVGEGEKTSIIYALEFEDVERWLGLFKQELEAGMKAAREVGGRLLVEDLLLYKLGWVNSDVAITRNKKSERVLRMTTSHLWQLAETHALFGWSRVVKLRMNLTLEGPKLAVEVEAPLENLDDAIRRSAERGWLKMLGVEAGLEDLLHAKSWDDLKRRVTKNWDIVVEAAVKRLGEKVRSKLNALRDRLNDDKVAREVVAPALLLIQAERLGVNEMTLKYFAAAVSGAIDGDGHVSAAMKRIELTSGEREIALLWGAVLAAHGIKTKVAKAGGAFRVVASGDDAVKLASPYFLFGPPLLEEDEKVINYKLAEAVKLGAEGLDISWEGLRQTKNGAAADLIISVGGAAVKYNVYLHKKAIELRFQSTDRSRVELAARLLRLAGVTAEVKREGVGDEWYVRATTDMLAAGREELRKALAELVREAAARGWIDAGKAERWLEKLEKGRVLREGWPKYEVRLVEGALVVRYETTNSGNIEEEAQQFRKIGLQEGKHFSVKMPEGGKAGYVSILKEGLAYAAWLSVRGEGEQQKLAAKFVEYILQRAKEEGEEVSEKAKKIIEEGKARGSLKLEGFEKKVEVNGKTYVVKVIGGKAVEEDRDGRKLLRIKIKAEVGRVEGEHTIVDRVVREYTITYSRHGDKNKTTGYAVARADAPGGREADAERFSVLIKALTGKEPRVYRTRNGAIIIMCGRKHLDGFRSFAELADAVEKWLEETRR